jgi:hypothetical protein
MILRVFMIIFWAPISLLLLQVLGGAQMTCINVSRGFLPVALVSLAIHKCPPLWAFRQARGALGFFYLGCVFCIYKNKLAVNLVCSCSLLMLALAHISIYYGVFKCVSTKQTVYIGNFFFKLAA